MHLPISSSSVSLVLLFSVKAGRSNQVSYAPLVWQVRDKSTCRPSFAVTRVTEIHQTLRLCGFRMSINRSIVYTASS